MYKVFSRTYLACFRTRLQRKYIPSDGSRSHDPLQTGQMFCIVMIGKRRDPGNEVDDDHETELSSRATLKSVTN